ncbi:hypothetical protein LshimejAT787_1401500 [Lyophyllum shimeji]|uniref:Uncharacterized protein n=1 Tax=Lyophyllum shimeji TaxID=47721 RepID=A0A9P3PXZ7_LYOSH|nr:hypothetical protein LshimejAT787_1401500 [Lyophyllum shimeji]
MGVNNHATTARTKDPLLAPQYSVVWYPNAPRICFRLRAPCNVQRVDSRPPSKGWAVRDLTIFERREACIRVDRRGVAAGKNMHIPALVH